MLAISHSYNRGFNQSMRINSTRPIDFDHSHILPTNQDHNIMCISVYIHTHNSETLKVWNEEVILSCAHISAILSAYITCIIIPLRWIVCDSLSIFFFLLLSPFNLFSFERFRALFCRSRMHACVSF